MRSTAGDHLLANGNASVGRLALSVVVPTRNEAGNIAALMTRLRAALRGIAAEVVFVDDSDDETPDVITRERGAPGLSLRLLHRAHGGRSGGLGGAVLEGVHASSGEWVLVMDGDLQHPPETIPALVSATTDADLVIASRHFDDGSEKGLSGRWRVLASGGASLLARCAFPRRLRRTTDPMSGFFAVRRAALDTSRLRPDGFKVLLEILVRQPALRVREVGFDFAPRHSGDSKAGMREALRYLRLLARLRASATRTLAFGCVGITGIGVNLGLVVLLVDGTGLHYLLAAALATQGSSCWNALLTEHLVFADRRGHAGQLGRLARSWLLNNLTLVLRLPLLALLVERVGMGYVAATLLTLTLAFVCRFVVTDRFIYRQGESMAVLEGKMAREPVDVVVDLVERQSVVEAPRYLPHRYSVPGIATIGSDVALEELEFFRDGTLGREVDIAVRVGHVGASPRLRARMTQHLGPAGVEYEEHLGWLGANFRVELGETIHVTAGPLLARSPHVLYTNVLEALLRFQAVSRGRMLLHSACLEIGGHGVLLSARTDTGKTGTVLKLLRESDARFLSDDMTVLEPDGTARCFPKPLTISQHTLHALGIDDLTKAEWRKLRIQSRLHSKEGRAFGAFLASHNLPIMCTNALTQIVVPPPKYDVRRLVPCDVQSEVVVTDLFVIERGEPSLEDIPPEALTGELIENTDDAYGFPPFRYFAPALVFGTDDYQTLRAKERAILQQAVAGVPALRLTSPDFSWANEIPALLEAPRLARARADRETAAQLSAYLGRPREGERGRAVAALVD